MKPLGLNELARVLGGKARGEADPTLTQVAIDGRRVEAGGLYVAIRGERFDGHDFIAQAAASGAAAALVERDGDWPLPVCRVADCRRALGALGRHNRRAVPARVAAITGSNGKTTVKEMLATILRRAGETLATQGNLNNELGVPLTLLRLDERQDYAVIEMGASAGGDIAYLCALAEPEVGLVTNAGPAHLEGFGDLDGVARGKGEMFAGIAPSGTAVINADDPYAPLWRELAGSRRVLDFGLEQPDAAVRAEHDGQGWLLHTPCGSARLPQVLPGRHNVLNALAAGAAALALGVSLPDIVQGLAALQPTPGRLHWRVGRGGARLLDDSYNANPVSLRAGLEVLAEQPGERWLVLGDMAELGPGADAVHAEAGRLARQLGVQRLFSCGPRSALAAESFGAGAQAFTDWQQAAVALAPQLNEGVCVLIKGSRSAGLDGLVGALAQPEAEEV
ncbi:UDP-N-acetylmuramoyl-tripeptide--D-alanyl-D-alanine ligase [Alkalilimnicola sp. S0819]|uniref:UDP-N-acetylmuramoyl-tripeptide--D-alanyl-D- alanine ligase n=1 Tax=Alkalilimnicola sp. S0819 TaxID=2613922 RepID=UPI001261C9AB|nr:UDP-N-acetylmuramoyl-tripeptide--D-alanyl-D-alanine ligase [Alkalilimnicola sp. S0819]KAB7623852.1 UDP-N-acetylmuramoyl-tripeptide--D-alanyl-D-alanine ligase [Alkalilimnicola sp. S0819]MPQ16729.1 UDP-N-acetylmuramoyl-tripeptide--D-alanyl-D-alanine ligase [Alkalilimnicola sp. S0819]